ncbi:MAG: hypothetical protein AAF525_18025 [Pseudomonadota bacterium]
MRKNMLRKGLMTITLLMLNLLTLQARGAPDLNTYIGVEGGLSTFSFEQKLDQQLVFPMANLTGGIAWERLSLAGTLSGSIADADVSEEDFTGSATRRDVDVTLGYQVLDNVSVFVGLKQGTTELDVVSRDEMNPVVANEEYDQSGVYLGASTGVSIGEGKLDVSIAYADLSSDNRFFADVEVDIEPEELEFDDISGANSGESTGFSFSVTWNQPINGDLLFRARFRHNVYEQDITFMGSTFSGIQEDNTSLSVGVLGVF